MKKFIKYRKNLAHDDNFVYSYKTTSKHINYAGKELGLRVETPEWL